MDTTDRKIIGILSTDARRSLADIGAEIGLSASATNERIRRLTANGSIRRFTIDADPAACGVPVLAFVCVALAPEADESAFRAYAAASPLIAECHHVTGQWSYLVKVHVGSLPDLEAFLADLKARRFIARSETIIALSSVGNAPFIPGGIV